jgi:hypothetical protein
MPHAGLIGRKNIVVARLAAQRGVARITDAYDARANAGRFLDLLREVLADSRR